MDRFNGNNDVPECPFRSDVRVDNGPKAAKPNLRLKVPAPLRLKNHLTSEENFDVLHSHIGDVSYFVSIFTITIFKSFYWINIDIHNKLYILFLINDELQ